MEPVLLEIKGKIATIRLNRPDKFNAINRETALLLQDKLKAAEENKDVRCIVLTGTAKAFCSGQDLTEIENPSSEEMRRILPEQLNPISIRLRNIQKPVLCVVNGAAVGAGANIALCCDIVVASDSAVFCQAFTRLGLISDSGGTYILPRLIGLRRATALMMLAADVSGREAAQMGMIYKSFPEGDLYREADKIADKLSKMPTRALVYTRLALNESMSSGFEEQLNHEVIWQGKAAATEDFREGIRAFLEKRKPDFKGK